MTRTSWNRVRRDHPCPICGKPDWCMEASDHSAVICARIKSDKPAGNKGAGWVHRVTNDWRPAKGRTVKRSSPRPQPIVDLDDLHRHCVASRRRDALYWLSHDLGISANSIEQFEVGLHPIRNIFSFVMRRPNGSICGIRYRTHAGKKFSETGGKNGLFFVPGSLNRFGLVIVEGATDAMAIHDIGIRSVIGRSNCTGNKLQVVTLCRRLRPQHVLIVPDNDPSGIAGANDLLSFLARTIKAQIVVLPDGVKDVRACVQDKKNADWLADQIGKFLNESESTSNGMRNDSDK